MSAETERRRFPPQFEGAAALKRIEDGEGSSEPIVSDRLEADPSASPCIDCASKAGYWQ